MSHSRCFLLSLIVLLASCSTNSGKDSIGQLKDVKIDLSDSKIEGGLDKVMQGYQKFLEQTPESAMAPEAMRRLADLKIQKEYGTLEGAASHEKKAALEDAKRIELAPMLDVPRITAVSETEAATAIPPIFSAKSGKAAAGKKKGKDKGSQESVDDFEKRATKAAALKSKTAGIVPTPNGAGADLQSAGTLEAIALYKKLLAKYPDYDRNDQVYYQLSRAYEETGLIEEAMKVMNRIVKEYPKSRYFDEVQFRRGEYFFTRKKFLDSENAFKSIVDLGEGSSYFELALYKLGWTYYKQELYEDALHRFVALLDYKIRTGYDFEHAKDTQDDKRVEDTYRVISLAFSNLGGADAVRDYFAKSGKRSYEMNIYGNLGDYYLDKRRYSDAANTFKAFVRGNPYHRVAPQFDTRVIETYKRGGFPLLVIESNKEFVVNYGLKSDYWKHFDFKDYPEVIGYVKTSLKELGNHYHSLFQEKKFAGNKPENFQEAMKWYREFLKSFPKEIESPVINFQLAELLLENKSFGQAAIEYEHAAYDYPYHEKSPDAGYAAVYAHRENMVLVGEDERERVRRDVIRSSLKFAESFPTHEKAALAMSAALDDIYGMKDYTFAVTTGRKLLEGFPAADQKIRRSAWLVVAHSSFELANYREAEEGYQSVMQLTDESDKSRAGVIENLAASIYKQAELASKQGDFKTAAGHFLRVAKSAPSSTIRPMADYDGATALMQLKDWEGAAGVLSSFRSNFPGHRLQPEVTKKIAYVYKEAGKSVLAAAEYERIETESKDTEVRREALQLAADSYVEARETEKALKVYRRYVAYFPKPLEPALEMRSRVADVLKARNETNAYLEELRQIVALDIRAGSERTDRTRYLGAVSSLVLTEPLFTQFAEIKLVKPFARNLARKKTALKVAKEGFDKLLQYQVGDVTSASTYYIAELYFNFNRALIESERPDDLNALEKEQYELGIEEQAFPFEEKAIQIHEKNLELLSLGVFSDWIDRSFEKLGKLVPARYAKREESSGYISRMDKVDYAALTDPVPVLAKAESVAAAQAASEPAPAATPAQPAPPVPAASEQKNASKKVATAKSAPARKAVKSKSGDAPKQG